MSLTNNDKAKIDRVLTGYSLWTWVKAVYILGALFFCGYTKYNGTYGIWYHQIVSFVLTANIIWIYFDIFENPIKRVIKLLK